MKTNGTLHSVKLNVKVINGEERFRCYILFCLKICLLKRKGGSNISRQILFIKLFTSLNPSLQIRKPVLNNQLEHDSLPLFRHDIM